MEKNGIGQELLKENKMFLMIFKLLESILLIRNILPIKSELRSFIHFSFHFKVFIQFISCM